MTRKRRSRALKTRGRVGHANAAGSAARDGMEAAAGSDGRANGGAPGGSARLPLALAAIAAGLCAIVTVSFALTDPDVWQHLTVGRVIWETRAIPTTQLWSWPTFGAPDVNSSWGFRALLWPFWALGGELGLFVWRWLTVLLAFGFGWLTARRMGARGFTPLVLAALLALTWRYRSQVRPETLIGVLFALQILILETRRRGGRDLAWLLVPTALVWANTHISWHLGLVAPIAYALDDWRARRASPAATRGARPLAVILGLMIAVSFVNPFGWRALWQPFDYVLRGRLDPIYQAIPELGPLNLFTRWRSWLPLLIGAWPVLLAWRWRRRGPDLAEALLCAGWTTLAIWAHRFAGPWSVIALPFLARDLSEWLSERRFWPHAGPWPRAAFCASLCVALSLPQWLEPGRPLGLGYDMRAVPVGACDFIDAHDIRGRAFNAFDLGGYMLWRFFPDRGRLPFMDIHQSGGPMERTAYVAAFTGPQGFAEADVRYDFDWVLLPARGSGLLPDVLDRDPAWALVFLDDAAALWLRRSGPAAATVRAFEYHMVPAGEARLGALWRAASADTAVRTRTRQELERQVSESLWSTRAAGMLEDLARLN